MEHLLNSYLLSFCYQFHAALNTLIMKKQKSGYSLNHYYEIVRNAVMGMHQRRMRPTVVDKATQALVNANIINQKYSVFEDLYADVDNIIGGIKGIGPLTVYDAALKLGCVMNPRVFPKDYVYIFANAPYKAACRLYGKQLKNIEPISTFSNYFDKVPSMYIEDFFCVMERFIIGKNKVETVDTKDLNKELRKYIIQF